MAAPSFTPLAFTWVAKAYGLTAVFKVDKISPTAWTVYYPNGSRLGARINVGTKDPVNAFLSAQIYKQFNLPASNTLTFVGM